MNKTELAANLVATGVLGVGIGLTTVNTVELFDDRDVYQGLVDEKAAAIQEYRAENPKTTTLPVAIEDEYAPKITAAGVEVEEAKSEGFTPIVIMGAGGVALATTMPWTIGRRKNSRYNNLVNDYNDLLSNYDALQISAEQRARRTAERQQALISILDVRFDYLIEDGVPESVIQETADRILQELDGRRDGEPLHADSRNQWPGAGQADGFFDSTPDDNRESGARFDVMSDVEAPADPANAEATVPSFRPVTPPEPEFTPMSAAPEFVVMEQPSPENQGVTVVAPQQEQAPQQSLWQPEQPAAADPQPLPAPVAPRPATPTYTQPSAAWAPRAPKGRTRKPKRERETGF